LLNFLVHNWAFMNFFGVCKSIKYLRNLCCLTFWFINILFRACLCQNNFQKKLGRNFIWVRIRIRTFSKVGSGSVQKLDLDLFKNRPDSQHWVKALERAHVYKLTFLYQVSQLGAHACALSRGVFWLPAKRGAARVPSKLSLLLLNN
jgi:hypothetical protein